MPKLVIVEVETIDHQETGKRSRKERNALGLSLRKVAELMDLGPPYLSDLERGRRNWNAKLMQQYCNALKGIRT